MALTQVTVTGTFNKAPGVASSGYLSFQLSADLYQNGVPIANTSPITADLNASGMFTVVLWANDDTGTQPSGTYWQVLGEIDNQRFSASYVISHTMAPTVDISTMTPATPGSSVFPVNAVQLQGNPVSSTAPTSNQVLAWNGSAWAPATVSGGSGAVSSVFTRTGAVVSATGDYTVAQVTGAAPLASPAFTGTPTVPTATALDNSTKAASTAYADTAVGVEKTRALAAESSNATAIATNTTAISTETSRATTAEALLAPKASPALTGTPTAPTAAPGTNTTQVATTAFVTTATGATGAGLPSNVVTKTATYTAGAGDYVQANATGGGFTVTLPTAPAVGALVAVKKIDLSANNVAVAPAGGGTIDGQASATITTQYAGAVLEHLGSNAWAVTAAMTTSGPQGPQGPTGPTGPQGATGPQGPGGSEQGLEVAGVIGQWYAGDLGGPYFLYSSTSVAVGTLLLSWPIIAQESMTIDQIGCYIGTGGAAGALVRLGIFSPPSNTTPYDLTLGTTAWTLVADGGTVAATTNGARAKVTLGSPVTIAAGTAFCVGVAVQGTGGAVSPFLWRNTATANGPWGSSDIVGGSNNGVTVPSIAGAFPSTVTPTAYTGSNFGGGGWFHRSA